MRDIDIRAELNRAVMAAHRSEPDTIVVEELNICQGESRVDLAVVNGEFCAWEIKSDHDSLQRLPRQAQLYGSVFDRVTLVTGPRFAESGRKRVPDWWGIILATGFPQRPFRQIRRARKNPAVEPIKLVQLLWRDELIRVLFSVGVSKGFANAPKRTLWQAVAEALPLRKLKAEIRFSLKARKDWRVVGA